MKDDPMVAEGYACILSRLNAQMSTEEMNEEDDDLPVFGDNLMDLMNAGGDYPMAIEDLSDDEKEDYMIRDTDALIVAGKIVLIS